MSSVCTPVECTSKTKQPGPQHSVSLLNEGGEEKTVVKAGPQHAASKLYTAQLPRSTTFMAN